jgi:hypothetical protein
MLKRLLQHFLPRASDGLANGQAHNGRTNGTSTTLPQATTALTNDSYTERVSAWASQAHLSKDEQLREWERLMEENFLVPIKTDPAKTDQLAFLKRLLRKPDQRFDSVEVGPVTL